MAQFIKHIGKHGDRRVCILFRQVPGEDHMALIIYPDVLPAHWQDTVQRVVESPEGQAAIQLADALHRSLLPDGRPILQTLHNERMIKKVRTSDIIVTPQPNSKIRLDELNTMLNKMEQGEQAIAEMAKNDAARGLVDPQVKRAAEAEFKQSQVDRATAEQMALQATTDGALSDRDIAANMVFQAKKMEQEATAMIAEASRMKKEAARMDPNVVAKEAPPQAPAKPKRGRPAKAQTADAAQ